MVMKECESCGMIMVEREDYGNMDPNNRYCVYCTGLDGKLKPFQVKLGELADLIKRRMRCTPEVAKKLAYEKLIKYPAWKDKGY